jgi:tetratricopeptide (TPR) repeat protein
LLFNVILILKWRAAMHRLVKLKNMRYIIILTCLFILLLSLMPDPEGFSGLPAANSTPTEQIPALGEEALSYFAVGVYLAESGETQQAVEYFEKAWVRSYRHPRVGTRLAEAYYKLKRFSSSELIADEVLAGDEHNYSALLIKAKLRYMQRDPKSSLIYLEKLVEHHGSTYEIQRMLGNIYFELGEEENALRAYENALQFDPNSSYMQHRYGLLLIQSGELDKAEQAFRRAIAIDPSLTESAVELAGLLIAHGQTNEATALLKDAIQRGQRTDRAILLLASLFLEMGQLDEGISLLEQEKSNGALTRDSYAILGRLYYEAKEYGEAEKIFLALFEQEESNSELARILADINLRSDKPQEALAYYRKAIELDPDDYRKYLGLFFAASPRFAPEGVSRIEVSNEEAAGFLKSAGSLVEADDFDGQYLVGMCYLSLDSLDAAKPHLQQALAINPNDEGALLNLANIAERTGYFEEAEGYLDVLYDLKPDDPTILNFYGYLLAEMGKDLDRAERLILKALDIEPGNGYYIDSLGWVYFQRGDYEKAVVELERAVKIVEDDPVILEHLGDAYQALKRFREALTAYRRSEALGGGDSGSDLGDKIKSAEKEIE